jgi:hypothetical protein
VTIRITPPHLNYKNPIPKRDSEFWARRRRWWAHHKVATGTDWVGIARTVVAVDDFLADLRRRGPA